MARPVVGVFSGEAVRVLVHVEGTHQHRASGLQALHQKGVGPGRRVAGIQLGAGQRDLALDVKEVLDRVGQTGKRRQGLTTQTPRIDGSSLMPRAMVADARERVEVRVGGLYASQAVLDHFAGTQITALHRIEVLQSGRPGFHASAPCSGNGAGQ